MVSSGMLRRVALVSVLTRTTRRNIPEDTILHSHRRENLKSYITETLFTHDAIVRNEKYKYIYILT
jgi:hypothetical protein